MIGETLGHYEIVDRLGAGGMGTVYRALDTKLRRYVALKVLPAELGAGRQSVERFQQEAEALAALAHPGIVTIYSVEEDGDHRFLTMELVEGAALDTLIRQGGSSVPEILDRGVAIAEALAAAHESGIVHRDVKPANVMVSDSGAVKVLDFGLAKLHSSTEDPELSSARTRLLTQHGTLLGTVPYMSPEQVRGGEVDGRSDVFSLGVVLYEMATGQRPFGGSDSGSVIAAIQRDVPVPADTLRPELPHHFARVVARCLEKDPDRRYQSMKDVRNELDGLRVESQAETARPTVTRSQAATAIDRPPADSLQDGAKTLAAGLAGDTTTKSPDPVSSGVWVSRRFGAVLTVAALAILLLGWWWFGRDRITSETTSSAAAPEPSIAVLAFEDLSPEGDQQYLSRGLAEELLNLLANTEGLRVAARTSSFSFEGQDVDVATIGQRLEVDAILEGSVRKAGNRIRVNAQLVDATSGFRRWSRSFERELDDLFAVQDDIAGAVARELRGSLLGDPSTPAADWRAGNAQAYNLFLQGKHLAETSRSEEGMSNAIGLLKEAHDLDPDSPQILTTLSYALINFASEGGHVSPESIRGEALDAVERAIDLDPGWGPAWAILGELYLEIDGDWEASARALERAAELAPDDPEVLRKRAELAKATGNFERAVELAKRALHLDPLSPLAANVLNYSLVDAGRLDESLALDQELFKLGMIDEDELRLGEAHVRLVENDGQGALDAVEGVEWDLRLVYEAAAHRLLGNSEATTTFFERAMAKKPGPFYLACLYAVNGDNDAAFEALKRFDAKDAGSLLGADPFLRYLHSDPRWDALLEKWNLAASSD